MHHLSEIDKSM